MNLLILIRHGHYGPDLHINDKGRDQMAKIAEKIKTLLTGRTAIILSSTADRAIESAEVLAEALGLPLEKHEILWSEKDRPRNMPGLLELIHARQNEVDCLILVTHMEYMERFPEYYSENEWDGQKIDFFSSAKGNGVALNCTSRTFKPIKHYDE